MQKIQYILAKFPFSCIIIAGIWVLCFMNIPDTPLSNIRLIDKWTHAVMYLVLGFSLIFEYLRANKKAKLKAFMLLGLALTCCYGRTHRDTSGVLYKRQTQWRLARFPS